MLVRIPEEKEYLRYSQGKVLYLGEGEYTLIGEGGIVETVRRWV